MPVSEERLAKYRELARTPSFEAMPSDVKPIFTRMAMEGVPVKQMRSSAVGMFMAPFRSADALDGVAIACVGVPMENSIPLRTSTRLGPQAVREWSQWQGPVHEKWKTTPFDLCSIADLGDIEFEETDIKHRIQFLNSFYDRLVERNINTLSVGGEHTMTYCILQALGRKQALGMVHVDAHGDTGAAIVPGDDDITSINDASPFRHAVCAGVIDPERSIQIGIRGRATPFWEFSREVGMTVVTAEDYHDRGIRSVIAEALEVIGDQPFYLSIDNDGLDPVDMPATGLPEPFGISALDVRLLIRGLRGRDLMGADFVELSPENDPTGQSANISAALCFEMLCLLSEARVTRVGKMGETRWEGLLNELER